MNDKSNHSRAKLLFAIADRTISLHSQALQQPTPNRAAPKASAGAIADPLDTLRQDCDEELLRTYADLRTARQFGDELVRNDPEIQKLLAATGMGCSIPAPAQDDDAIDAEYTEVETKPGDIQAR